MQKKHLTWIVCGVLGLAGVGTSAYLLGRSSHTETIKIEGVNSETADAMTSVGTYEGKSMADKVNREAKIRMDSNSIWAETYDKTGGDLKKADEAKAKYVAEHTPKN